MADFLTKSQIENGFRKLDKNLLRIYFNYLLKHQTKKHNKAHTLQKLQVSKI
jgi:hypothetical protein